MSPTEWQPAHLFAQTQYPSYGLVILNQPIELPAAVLRHIWAQTAPDCHIAADGGANQLYACTSACTDDTYPLIPDAIVGDLDSLHPTSRAYFEARGSRFVQDTSVDQTDMHKAVQYIRQLPNGHGARDIICLGGLGGRVDQAMSILHQLYTLQGTSEDSAKLHLVTSEAITFVLRKGTHRIRTRDESLPLPLAPGVAFMLGEHVGIIPLREPAIITTSGLTWDVTDWETSFGHQMSTSNLVRETWVTVETSKDVLFTMDFKILA